MDEAEIDDELRAALKETFAALADREEDILGEIRQETAAALKGAGKNKNIAVVTLLAAKDSAEEMKARHFFRISESGKRQEADISRSLFYAEDDFTEENNLPEAGPFFLRCPYEDMDKYLNREYAGHIGGENFSYRLVVNDRFIRQEERLARLFRLYRLETPVIFSPYARRAVDICLDKTVSAKNWRDMNLALEENNLDGVLITDRILMWNVNFLPDDKECDSSVAPDEGEVKRKHIFVAEKNIFLLPKTNPDNDDFMDIRRTEDNIVITAPENFEIEKCVAADIVPPDMNKLPADAEVFANRFNTERLFVKSRLFSAGDVEYVLKNFDNGDFSAEFSHWGRRGDEKIILAYSKEHGYSSRRDQRLIAVGRKMPPCFVKFAAPPMYLTDWANFVLNYLGKKYPEFLWLGAVK